MRNDTGVYEGGEISMYYDPMIAKLCTWGPDRATAIENMRNALDGFEVEGIGHNLPFLSAVYDHPKFIAGEMTTAFIEEEYPEGFEGVNLPYADLERIAAATASMYRVAEIRRTRVSGRMDNHERVVPNEWVVQIGDLDFPLTIEADKTGSTVLINDKTLRCESTWVPGQSLAVIDMGDESGQNAGGVPHPQPGCRYEGLCPLAAGRRTVQIHDRKIAAGHVQIVALPDAGSDRQSECRRGR